MFKKQWSSPEGTLRLLLGIWLFLLLLCISAHFFAALVDVRKDLWTAWGLYQGALLLFFRSHTDAQAQAQTPPALPAANPAPEDKG